MTRRSSHSLLLPAIVLFGAFALVFASARSSRPPAPIASYSMGHGPTIVLVAPVTNPAWTPLFQRAVAVVVDTGGAASHAAIVAREYGVPAVMGTMNGTKELKDGQWIQVDGSRGLVLKGEASK